MRPAMETALGICGAPTRKARGSLMWVIINVIIIVIIINVIIIIINVVIDVSINCYHHHYCQRGGREPVDDIDVVMFGVMISIYP